MQKRCRKPLIGLWLRRLANGRTQVKRPTEENAIAANP